MSKGDSVYALFQYASDEPSDLAFARGAKITLVSAAEDDWFMGRLAHEPDSKVGA